MLLLFIVVVAAVVPVVPCLQPQHLGPSRIHQDDLQVQAGSWDLSGDHQTTIA